MFYNIRHAWSIWTSITVVGAISNDRGGDKCDSFRQEC